MGAAARIPNVNAACFWRRAAFASIGWKTGLAEDDRQEDGGVRQREAKRDSASPMRSEARKPERRMSIE
jgi:hypothetical protein